MKIYSKLKKNPPLFAGVSFISLFCATLLITTGVRACQLHENNEVTPLSADEEKSLETTLKTLYSEKYQLLQEGSYKAKSLNVKAKSAIAVSTTNGNIIYEKNPDTVIPPASMTKIAVMYVVGEEIKQGRVKLDDIIPIHQNSWACNMPPHSSLMFLGKNQIVTLRELMTGLAVCSGNDASYAIAYHLYGGIEPFIAKMNALAARLGLTHTHFIETSGYSEQNTTTAREMATLALEYVRQFPEFLKMFHSVEQFEYPKEHNLAPEDREKPRAQDFKKGFPEHITMGITQKNTNPLLGKLKGCDGLKTGYIDESGYNLILTCDRDGLRFLSVTMGGPGNNTKEGQAGRVADGTEIMEWAYSNFAEVKDEYNFRSYKVPLVKSNSMVANLVPAYDPKSVLVPLNLIQNSPEPMKSVVCKVNVPSKLSGKIIKGQVYGSIAYEVKVEQDTFVTLEEVPLVADRTIESANFFMYWADSIAEGLGLLNF